MTSANRRRGLGLAAALPIAVIATLASLPTTSAQAVSTSLVLAEVYGGGGNAGPPAAPYKNDFIELRNIGSSTVDVSSYSVQYASAAGSSWQLTPAQRLDPGRRRLPRRGGVGWLDGSRPARS